MSESLGGLPFDFYDLNAIPTGSLASDIASNNSLWGQVGNFLGSEKGQQALSGLGKSLLGTAGQANPNYLKISAGTAPYSQGGTNSLLNTMLQMQLQNKQQQQFPLGQNFRASLLG